MTSCMTNKEILQWAIAELGAEKRMEAELLLCHVLNTNRGLLLAHDTDCIAREQAEVYRDFILRRKNNEPFQTLQMAGYEYRCLYLNNELRLPSNR